MQQHPDTARTSRRHGSFLRQALLGSASEGHASSAKAFSKMESNSNLGHLLLACVQVCVI